MWLRKVKIRFTEVKRRFSTVESQSTPISDPIPTLTQSPTPTLTQSGTGTATGTPTSAPGKTDSTLADLALTSVVTGSVATGLVLMQKQLEKLMDGEEARATAANASKVANLSAKQKEMQLEVIKLEEKINNCNQRFNDIWGVLFLAAVFAVGAFMNTRRGPNEI